MESPQSPAKLSIDAAYHSVHTANQTQSWDRTSGKLVDDPEKFEACVGRAVMVKLSDPARGPVYARKEAEARDVLAGGTMPHHVLIAEAAARDMTVEQLAALVVQRAEADRDGLARAWGRQEAVRVASQRTRNRITDNFEAATNGNI